MSEHTPGPWVFDVGRNDHSEPVIGVGPEADVTDTVIAEVALGDRLPGDIEWANARLIAAAPDLLAALKDLLAHSHIADSASEDKDAEDHAAERAARHAITKAEGKQP